MYRGNIYVSNSKKLKNIGLIEMNSVPFVGHLGYQKSIVVVRSQHFWLGVTKEVANYITNWLECQKLKAEHRHPTRMIQPFPILEWKWEVATVDFITNFPKTMKQHDSIMVVVDKLTKDAHFIPMKTTHKETNIVEIYMKEFARLPGVPKEIV
jgi:hypothetical protein